MYILYIIIAIVLLVGIIILLRQIAKNKIISLGKRGENYVRSVLGNTIEGEQYVINNYTIEKDNKSSQIDHILINKFGIFVIETKNYSGNIYGNDNQQEWTQVLNYGRIKNKFYNPVKQNASHVYKIRSVLHNYPIHSVVVFVQNNVQYINSSNVIPLSKLRIAVTTGTPMLNAKQMRNAYDTLIQHRSSITNDEHIKNIRKQQNNIAHNICPRCGGQLLLRNGQYGKFYGCSNYPRCKFKKKI